MRHVVRAVLPDSRRLQAARERLGRRGFHHAERRLSPAPPGAPAAHAASVLEIDAENAVRAVQAKRILTEVGAQAVASAPTSPGSADAVGPA